MKPFISLTPLLFLGFALFPGYANSQPDQVEVVNQTLKVKSSLTSEVRFVGFAPSGDGSGHVIHGKNLEGYPAMHAICAAHIPHSRACTSEEAARSIAPDTSERGWVIPSQVRVLADPAPFTDNEDLRCLMSYDGATAAPLVSGACFGNADAHVDRIACASYTSTVDSGIAFGANGVETASCASGLFGGEGLSIACCAAVKVRIRSK